MEDVINCTVATGVYNITNTSWQALLYYDYQYTDIPVGYAFILYMLDDIFPLIVTLVAVFGNITIIATLKMKKNRTFSTASFFISLAVSDLIAAVYSTLISWISRRAGTWNMDIDCKITPVFIYASKSISSFSLAAITVERAISVCFPHKVKLICSKKTAQSVLIAIWVSNISFFIFVSFNLGAISQDGYEFCSLISDNFVTFMTYVFPWVSMSLDFFIPFLVILIGTVIIINKLYLRSKKNDASKRTRLKNVSFTLITTNVVFVLTKSPWFTINLYSTIRIFKDPCWSLDIETGYFLNSVFIFIDDLNQALNFFIYFLSGSQFRNDVKSLMIGLFKKVCKN